MGEEMSTYLYPILFDQIRAIVETFFDQHGQVNVTDINTQFIEHIIYIMKSILDPKPNKDPNSEQPSTSENLGVTSIEGMMLGIVRYVRHLDMTVYAIRIKTKLCQLVEVMMKRRDDLAFRQEMKFRNKLVEYLSDWVMGTSHQIAPPSSTDPSLSLKYKRRNVHKTIVYISLFVFLQYFINIPRFGPSLYGSCGRFAERTSFTARRV